MHPVVKDVHDSLLQFSDAVISSHASNVALNASGWNFPVLSRDDLAYMPKIIALRISQADITGLDDSIIESLRTIPEKLTAFRNTTVCYGDVDHPVPGQIDHRVS